MVSFQCENCGDTVKKAKLEQHARSCRPFKGFTCIDCMKTFQQGEYQKHTQCMTEAEKYQGKLYKGPRTQPPPKRPAQTPPPPPAKKVCKEEPKKEAPAKAEAPAEEAKEERKKSGKKCNKETVVALQAEIQRVVEAADGPVDEEQVREIVFKRLERGFRRAYRKQTAQE